MKRGGDADEACAVLLAASCGVEGLDSAAMAQAMGAVWEAVLRESSARAESILPVPPHTPSPSVEVLSTLLNKCAESEASAFVDRFMSDMASHSTAATTTTTSSRAVRCALKGVFVGLTVRNHARGDEVGRVSLAPYSR